MSGDFKGDDAAEFGLGREGASIRGLAAKRLTERSPTGMTAILAAYQPPPPSKTRDRELKSPLKEASGHLGAGRR